MQYERTRDIIEHARDFHERMEHWCRELCDRAQRHRVRIALDYLARHQRNVRDQLARYETHAADKVLDTWFQYVPEEDTLERFEGVRLDDDMTVEQVIDAILEFDRCLVSLFRECAHRALSDDVREVLSSLLELEEEEQIRLKRIALDAKRL